ncbi:hypothetical protein V1527DRAFT_499452 [Lipomyces starkeyi]
MSMIPMTIAKIDHSVKNGQQSVTALLSCINEYGEIDLKATKKESAQLGRLWNSMGCHPPPKFAYTGNVRADSNFLFNVITSLKAESSAISKEVAVPDPMAKIVGDASSTSNGPVIIGLDAEWNRGSDSTDLALLAFKDTVVLMRLYQMRECPIRLQELPTSPAVMKVGCRVSGDITRI